MANESFELGRELTGAFRRGTQVGAAKSDKSLPIQQICASVHVCVLFVYSYASESAACLWVFFFFPPLRDCVHPV